MYYVCNGVTLIEQPSMQVAARRYDCIDAHASAGNCPGVKPAKAKGPAIAVW
jgi:hypothetical protein